MVSILILFHTQIYRWQSNTRFDLSFPYHSATVAPEYTTSTIASISHHKQAHMCANSISTFTRMLFFFFHDFFYCFFYSTITLYFVAVYFVRLQTKPCINGVRDELIDNSMYQKLELYKLNRNNVHHVSVCFNRLTVAK